MREQFISGRMPVLALRGLTIFPEQTVHFDVGRVKSAMALEYAMKHDQQLILVPQKNILDDDPGLNGLYPMGTIVKIKQILKDKKGIALENAILFEIIIFSLCFLLTSLTLIGHYQVKIENLTLLNDVEIEQIGDDYLASVKAGEKLTKDYTNYAYEVSGNTLTVWHKNDESKSAVLYVEAELVDEQLNVSKWRYSLPTNAVGE